MELVVNGTLQLEDNLKVLEAGLLEAMKKYDIVVTEDNIADSKKQRAEVNKGKKAIMDAWKERKKELLAPIDELDARLKSLLTICDQTIERIDAQVAKFEAGKRALAQKLSEEYRDFVCAEKGISPETISVFGFDNLTYITTKGELASPAKAKIDNLVLAEVARIAEIKAKEAEAVLERERIREEAKAEAMAEAKERAMAQVKEELAKNNPFADSEPVALVSPSKEETPKPSVTSDGKTIYRIHAYFEVSGEAGIEAKVLAKFREEIVKNPLLQKSLKALEC